MPTLIVMSQPVISFPHHDIGLSNTLLALVIGFALAFLIALFERWLDKRKRRR